jgi:hypothetical protein
LSCRIFRADYAHVFQYVAGCFFGSLFDLIHASGRNVDTDTSLERVTMAVNVAGPRASNDIDDLLAGWIAPRGSDAGIVGAYELSDVECSHRPRYGHVKAASPLTF